ncbi:MAG: bifunctional demethylmenaquinone methyltransferase/2-methoxy-6-polyprenyl-1,4-benzoquinol methylase [Gammaproteobacteria bacterium 39-13]|nr:bifunctional demethylmenaquinone methyltransferase/2-methoxy-6-polyprenyl-1,4-benzoquinol methylase UbiE [Gammaproteobacteria bacterium]OJV90553.1 MAG: bifunctional demethylmenaquinone methyltransferase/2-methoxy-6-polyprenyl-1,4-benzoquinol methylase [Gammaproteobacteria bacterium 39-13]
MKDDTTDFGFTKVKATQKHKLVGQVFDSVASSYDLMNDLMSLGIHRLWKRHAIALAQIRPNQHVLDLAAGTGDLTRLIVPKVTASGQVTLSDINMSMLAQAKIRLTDEGIFDNIRIVQADAQHLPFNTNTFDRIIMGFGLRNVTFKEKALQSMYRVLKPGGHIIILEFSHPTNATFSKLYDTYSFHVLPKLGEWVAKDGASYQYLAESIRMHPNQEKLKELILQAGFDVCHYHNLTGGIVAIHKGIKY